MTQTSNRLLDDLTRLMTDAAGAAQGMRREVEGLMKSQAERVLQSMDIVTREEFEAVKLMAAKAREENERLSALTARARGACRCTRGRAEAQNEHVNRGQKYSTFAPSSASVPFPHLFRSFQQKPVARVLDSSVGARLSERCSHCSWTRGPKLATRASVCFRRTPLRIGRLSPQSRRASIMQSAASRPSKETGVSQPRSQHGIVRNGL